MLTPEDKKKIIEEERLRFRVRLKYSIIVFLIVVACIVGCYVLKGFIKGFLLTDRLSKIELNSWQTISDDKIKEAIEWGKSCIGERYNNLINDKVIEFLDERTKNEFGMTEIKTIRLLIRTPYLLIATYAREQARERKESDINTATPKRIRKTFDTLQINANIKTSVYEYLAGKFDCLAILKVDGKELRSKSSSVPLAIFNANFKFPAKEIPRNSVIELTILDQLGNVIIENKKIDLKEIL